MFMILMIYAQNTAKLDVNKDALLHHPTLEFPQTCSPT